MLKSSKIIKPGNTGHSDAGTSVVLDIFFLSDKYTCKLISLTFVTNKLKCIC